MEWLKSAHLHNWASIVRVTVGNEGMNGSYQHSWLDWRDNGLITLLQLLVGMDHKRHQHCNLFLRYLVKQTHSDERSIFYSVHEFSSLPLLRMEVLNFTQPSIPYQSRPHGSSAKSTFRYHLLIYHRYSCLPVVKQDWVDSCRLYRLFSLYDSTQPTTSLDRYDSNRSSSVRPPAAAALLHHFEA